MTHLRTASTLALLWLLTGLSPAAEGDGGENGADAGDPLVGLKGPYLDQRRAAVRTIAALDDADQGTLVDDLVALLDADNWQTQLHAAKALAKIGAEAEPAVPELVARMKTAMERNDATLFDLLGRTVGSVMPGVDPKDMKGVLTLMKTAAAADDQELFDTLATSLTASGEESVPTLIRLLGHEKDALRRQAVLALRGVGEAASEAIPHLLETATLHPELAREIDRTLQAVKAENSPPTAEALEVECVEGRRTALEFVVSDSDDLTRNLEVEPAEKPEHGKLVRKSKTAFRYVSAPGWTGEDTCTFKVDDGHDKGEPVAVTISVVEDTRPPAIASVAGAGPQGVHVEFDEAVAVESVSDVAAYDLGEGVAVSGVEVADDGGNVKLTTGSPLEEGREYVLRISGLRDVSEAGNTGDAEGSFVFHGTQPGLVYGVYETKDFDAFDAGAEVSMEPTETGVADTFDIGNAGRDSNYAMIFTGVIRVPESGEYTFFTESDDGSGLYVDGERIVDNSGMHGMETKQGKIQLEGGDHEIAVTFYQGGGGQGLNVSWQGPGIAKEKIPAAVLMHRP